jgi:hypothetical protein
MTQREIAAQKSIVLGTVKTRLQLAQKKLLNQLVPIQNEIWVISDRGSDETQRSSHPWGWDRQKYGGAGNESRIANIQN